GRQRDSRGIPPPLLLGSIHHRGKDLGRRTVPGQVPSKLPWKTQQPRYELLPCIFHPVRYSSYRYQGRASGAARFPPELGAYPPKSDHSTFWPYKWFIISGITGCVE